MPRIKTPKQEELPPVSFYLEQLDLARVAEQILATESGRPLSDEEFEDAKRVVWEACERWLPSDIYDLDILGVEVPYDVSVDLDTAGQQPVKAFIDVLARSRGRLNAQSAGKKVIIDWKTTSRLTLDTQWKERYTESWQGPIYSFLEPAEIINFRGITRGAATPGEEERSISKFADILVELRPDNREVTRNQITGLSLQRQALVNSGLTIWPMNKPHACFAYGRDCPFKPTCPGEPGLIPADKSFSHSSMGTFMLCPERNRRTVMESLKYPGQRGSIDGSDESMFGTCVHNGLAEVYRQVMEKFQ